MEIKYHGHIPEIPGFKFTGELRVPKPNEYYIEVDDFVRSQKMIVKSTIGAVVPAFIYESVAGIIRRDETFDIAGQTFRATQIYNKNYESLQERIPKGYEVLRLDYPKAGEKYLDLYFKVRSDVNFTATLLTYGSVVVSPRLIVREISTEVS